ncbi:hypothetical protein AQ720_05850 [Burkholderia pseudomallei]|nr:hypothetical protein AQ720_05850 [Burkholderia pseudomallei]
MLIEAVGTRAWVCHQCDPIDSIVSQPFHGALKQLTSNTHMVWVDSILGYREADVVKCTDVTLSHRTVF